MPKPTRQSERRSPSIRAAIPGILEAIAGGEAAYKAIEAAGVKRATFYDAINADEALADKYARAMQAGCEPMADDIMAISDDPTIEPNHKRIMVDSRKWLLSKRLPKKYGDKLDVELGGNVYVTIRESDA